MRANVWLTGLAFLVFLTPVMAAEKDKLDPANWSLDHQTPTSRGGSFTLTNLAVICESCNRVKGILDAQEYARLWEVIRSWPKTSRRNLLARPSRGASCSELTTIQSRPH